jgi:truncated hemoglobin YjbI
MSNVAGDLFRELMEAHPRIRERGLEARLVRVLNDAYAFDVARGLQAVDADAAEDCREILQAALRLASTVVRLPESDRPSELAGLMDSLLPPPNEES